MSLEDYRIEKLTLGYTIRHYKGDDTIVKLPSHFNGNAIEIIGDYAFCGKKSINQVIIPSGIKCIDFYAFAQCSNLESIIIPNTVSEINSHAFYECYSLKQVIFKGTKAQWNKIYSYDDYIKTAFDGIVVFEPESDLTKFLNDALKDGDLNSKDI